VIERSGFWLPEDGAEVLGAGDGAGVVEAGALSSDTVTGAVTSGAGVEACGPMS